MNDERSPEGTTWCEHRQRDGKPSQGFHHSTPKTRRLGGRKGVKGRRQGQRVSKSAGHATYPINEMRKALPARFDITASVTGAELCGSRNQAREERVDWRIVAQGPERLPADGPLNRSLHYVAITRTLTEGAEATESASSREGVEKTGTWKYGT